MKHAISIRPLLRGIATAALLAAPALAEDVTIDCAFDTACVAMAPCAPARLTATIAVESREAARITTDGLPPAMPVALETGYSNGFASAPQHLLQGAAAGSGVHLYFVPGQLAAMHRFDAAAGQGTLYLGECSAR